ncbi:LexA family protein [Phenylobacterium conjunctum]|uniref:LexA family protein n=1 Tax=Phenylobacterium conjunctum TaxID=1298959 RepID=A0ABW3SY34_9CAUL
MSALTHRQAECLGFIREYAAKHGASPSFSEIAVALGLSPTSKGNVSTLVGQLVGRGYLRHARNRARSLEIVEHRTPLTRFSTQELEAELERRAGL